MKLIDVSCPRCRSVMKVDKKNKEIKCEYCGHIFLMDDEVVKVVHMQNGEITEEQEYKNAETNLNKFKDYEKAFKLYSKLSDRYADNPEIWIGLLRCISLDFSNKEYDLKYEDYWNRFTSLADKKEIEEWEKKYDKFINSFNGYEKLESHSDTEKDYIYVTTLGGWFGLHKFMKGEVGKGILYLFTGGLFCIGWIMDIIKEIKLHPSKKQKLYNCLGIFAIVLGFAYIDYSIIGALMIIASGIMCFKKITMLIWKNPVSYSKFIKIGLFVLGFLICTISAPAYIGTWYYCSDTNCTNVIELYIGSSTISKKDGVEDISYEYKAEEFDKEYKIKYENIELKYNKEDNSFCFTNGLECSIYLNKDKEELKKNNDKSEENENLESIISNNKVLNKFLNNYNSLSKDYKISSDKFNKINDSTIYLKESGFDSYEILQKKDSNKEMISIQIEKYTTNHNDFKNEFSLLMKLFNSEISDSKINELFDKLIKGNYSIDYVSNNDALKYENVYLSFSDSGNVEIYGKSHFCFMRLYGEFK